MDYYCTLFGMPVRYPVETSPLTSSCQDLQRQLHPDRFCLSAGMRMPNSITAGDDTINKAY